MVLSPSGTNEFEVRDQPIMNLKVVRMEFVVEKFSPRNILWLDASDNICSESCKIVIVDEQHDT